MGNGQLRPILRRSVILKSGVLMKVSVLLCTYNGASRLPATLQTLAAQELSSNFSWELLLIDNASTDQTAVVATNAAATFPAPVRVLHESRPGKANALQTAFREAQGQYYCIVDDDNLLDPDYLANGIAFLDDHPDVASIGGRTFPQFPEGIAPPHDFDATYSDLLACRDHGSDIIWNVRPPGAGQMGRLSLMRAIYSQIGTRLEDRVADGVGCCEDLEKGCICTSLGWRTTHVPTLRLYHVLTERRLTEVYIDRLACAAVSTIPWLRLISGEEPNVAARHFLYGIADICRVIKYWGLSFVPTRMHPKLRRVHFWRRFYAARANGYFSLIQDRKRIGAMFAAIEQASTDLRPPESAMSCAETRLLRKPARTTS